MKPMQEIDAEFGAGIVSEAGLLWLADAEVYGNAASIRALEKRLLVLKSKVTSGLEVAIHHPSKGRSVLKTEGEFMAWCKEHFPSASVGAGTRGC